jgi:hypothetical protein
VGFRFYCGGDRRVCVFRMDGAVAADGFALGAGGDFEFCEFGDVGGLRVGDLEDYAVSVRRAEVTK